LARAFQSVEREKKKKKKRKKIKKKRGESQCLSGIINLAENRSQFPSLLLLSASEKEEKGGKGGKGKGKRESYSQAS